MDISKFLSQLMTIKWAMEPWKAIAFGNVLNSILQGSFELQEEAKIMNARMIHPDGNQAQLFSEANNIDLSSEATGTIPEGSTIIIPVKGVMFKEDTWFSYGTESIANLIRQAANHKNVTSIIEIFDTGGGSVDSIFPIIDANNFAKSKKPVVGIADMAASAGYYSIASTDLIIASNDISSEFGSIGVMISFADLQPYWEKMGVKFHKIYAPESTHKNLAFENALKGNYVLMKKEVLSPIAQKFQSDVRTFRKGKVDITQKGILNGKMYYANDAIRFGLADELGNLDYAIKRANDLAKNKK